MKKYIKVFAMCTLLCLSVFFLPACNSQDSATYEVVSEVEVYGIGDELDPSAYLVVTEKGKTKQVPVTADMVSGFSTEKIAGMAEATVTYGDVKVPYYYFVAAPLNELSDTGATTYKDLSYGTSDSNVFDLYLPYSIENLSGNEPVFLYVHGGGWMMGDKSENASTILAAMVDKGFVVLSMAYTLASATSSVMVQFSEIGAMVAYMKSFLPSIGVNSSKISIGGYSAGGHLSTWYAYASEGYSPLKIAFLVDIVGPVDISDEGYRLALQNLIDLEALGIVKTFLPTVCGAIGIPADSVNLDDGDASEIWNAVSKLSGMPYITSSTCPTIMMYASGTSATNDDGTPNYGGIFVTQNDGLVPLSCFTTLKGKLDANGVVNVSRVIENETHMTLGNSKEAISWVSSRAFEYAVTYLS